MTKKTFGKGIDNLIKQTEVKQSIVEDKRNIINTTIDIDTALIKGFKIALLKNNISVFDFWEKSINDLINGEQVYIPKIEKLEKLKKYSFRLYSDTRDKLKIYCAEKELLSREVCIFLMKSIIK